MRILTGYILREHGGPFVLSLAILTFLFLMQYLIEILDMVIGKGLEVQVVVELFVLNIAWMLALTVPMAVLVAVLMSFGRMSHDGEITALKASGIGITRLLVPVLAAGIVIAALLTHFNDRILPEFNYRAKTLTSDIRAKRPTLALRTRVFLETVDGYRLYLEQVDPATSRVEGITIVQYLNYAPPDPPRIIKAAWGIMTFDEEGEELLLDLRDGTVTEIQQGQSRLQSFSQLKTFLSLTGTQLQRSDHGIRGDRELSIGDMRARIAQRDSAAVQFRAEMATPPLTFLARAIDGAPRNLPGAGRSLQPEARVITAHRSLVSTLESSHRMYDFYRRQSNRYAVEVHKKYAIPFACIAFILVGVPLAVMARRGGVVISFGVALFFFLLYWTSLILGESLADRMLIAPWISMWFPNILVTTVEIFMIIRGVYEQTFIQWDQLARRLPGKLGVRLARRLAETGRPA